MVKMTIDSRTLRDRRATGCLYDVGLCLCPDPPFQYEGCKAPDRQDKTSNQPEQENTP